MMARDCNRFCKIMSLANENANAIPPLEGNLIGLSPMTIVQKKRKICFADEAGGTLCHVKFYKTDPSPPLNDQIEAEGSSIRTSEVEEMYFKLLQEADVNIKVKVTSLRKFIEGSLTVYGTDDICPQFDDLFPLDLHPHSVSRRKFRVIRNVVPIDEPETSPAFSQ